MVAGTLLPYQKVVVTGAGRGIGRMASLALAQLGAEVVAISRTPSDLYALSRAARSMRGKIIPFCGDVTKVDHMAQVFKDIASTGRPVDSLICCAGVLRPTPPLAASNPHAYLQQVQSEINGVYIPTREFVRYANGNAPGLILHFSSMAAIVPVRGYGAYGIGKAAVEHFSATVAQELRGSRIVVGCIRPYASGVRRGRFSSTGSDRRAVRLLIRLAFLDPDRIHGRVFVT
jgi:NAD(P)-dependent dehydrogenase (short-subunit alcohol dehydrogenase family)